MSYPSALIAGSTGLVGHQLLKVLLKDDYFSTITLVVREALAIENSRVRQVVLPNFDDLESIAEEFDVHHVFCCLGTNLRSPGARDIFRKVNLDYPLKMAKIAKKQPTFQCFHAITSIGASKDALLYYNTVKGQLETALQKQNLPALKIYRPSLLLGKRKQTSNKEEIMKLLATGLSFLIIKRRQLGPGSIHAAKVAQAMLQVAKLNEIESEVFRPRDMVLLAQSSKLQVA